MMGLGCCDCDEESERYDENHPAVDSDGYVEDWWKRAVDDSEMLFSAL